MAARPRPAGLGVALVGCARVPGGRHRGVTAIERPARPAVYHPSVGLAFHESPPAPITDVTRILFDFSDASAADGWTAIDDRVMGGMSRSRLRSDLAGHAVFEGVVSLAQGGGFASVRSPTGDFGLPGAQACIVEARGIGSHFKLSLFTDGGFDAASHQAEFAPAGPDWQTLRLPLADFSATFRGRVIPGADPLDPARIRQIGLVIARRQAGSFSLDLRKISLD